MSWADLEPIIRTTPSIRASLVILKGGINKLSISFSASFLKDLGDPVAMNAQAGSGDTEGLVRLIVAADGKFKLADFDKGGGRISMNAPEWCPDDEFETQACDVVSNEAGVIVVRLPLKAWKTQRDAVDSAKIVRSNLSAARTPIINQVQKTVTSMPTVIKSAALDACDFLKKKGVKIQRLADNFFSVNSERVDKAWVLHLVNEHRAERDLKPLTLADIY